MSNKKVNKSFRHWNAHKEQVSYSSVKRNNKAWRSKIVRIRFEDWEQSN